MSAQCIEDDSNSMFMLNIDKYYIVGDGKHYDKHMFSVHITANQSAFSYHVDRSYVDFVDLDRRIRRKFPHTTIPRLPLDAKDSIEKYLTRDGNGTSQANKKKMMNDVWQDELSPYKDSNSGNSSNNSRSAIGSFLFINSSSSANNTNIGSSNSSSANIQNRNATDVFTSPAAASEQLQCSPIITESESLASRIDYLNVYLLSLLNLYELVGCEELLLFLDEEASSMRTDLNALLPLSVNDLLLSGTQRVSTVVRKNVCKSFMMKKDDIIVWKFMTKEYDIGFNVDYNDDTKVVYTRCQSHEAPITGCLTVTENGICKLKWDNSYARFRSKQLLYAAKIVTADDYESAYATALELQKEKRKFVMQRNTIKRYAISRASKLSPGFIRDVNVDVVEGEEEWINIQMSQQVVDALNKEIDALKADIENALLDIEELENEKVAAEDARDKMSESWRFTVVQLEGALTELKVIKQERDDLRRDNKEMKLQVHALSSAITSENKYHNSNNSSSSSSTGSTQGSLATAAGAEGRDIEQLVNEITELKQRSNEYIVTARATVRREMEEEIAEQRYTHEQLVRTYEAEIAELKSIIIEKDAIIGGNDTHT